jgi:large subunit ribosomal protein L10
MITKEQKKEIVAELTEKFKKATAYYLVDFTKMTVADSIRLRRELRKNELEYKVAKNTLIKRAMDDAGLFALPQEKMFGPSGIVFSYNDPVSPARLIKEQYDKFERPVLKAAILEDVFYDGSQLKMLAALPSKTELIAAIMGSLDAPISGIIGSIGAVIRDVAYLVEEVAKKRAS